MPRNQQFIDKELSWLSFNERVLQEAADKSVPIIERVRFLGIFSNNQDEFFRVRVADVKRRILIHEEQGGDPHALALMSAIQSQVLILQQQFDDTYREILDELSRRRIFIVDENELSDAQARWVRRYFAREILHLLVPIWLDSTQDLSTRLSDDKTYLAVEIQGPEGVRYALVDIPSDELPRFVLLPKVKGKQQKVFILLDNIIRFCLPELFSGLVESFSLRAYSMKLTRDAEFELSGDIDESLVDKMSQGLKQRLISEPVRYVYDREMPAEMLRIFGEKFGISSYDSLIPGGRYHNFKDFIGFPNISGYKYLEYPKLQELESRAFKRHTSAFNAIREQDILIYYPYHTFRHFTEFVRQAAYDPRVRSIKLNIYRVAKNSRIIASLLDAVLNGKQVTVVVELRARFDEEANIEWAKVLTDGGVNVEFGLPSLKVHSKLCLITREEKVTTEDGSTEPRLVRYAHIGTGNFHEKTARIYTDFSLFTCHDELSEEVEKVFEFISRSYKRFNFKHLLVSPLEARNGIYRLLEREIDHAKAGKKAEIFIKINNLVDKGVIRKLYRASEAGVKIRMIIRGMCALIPGIKGQSENIQIRSVVDRFLEHPRVIVTHNGGKKEVYISSADLMTRNLDYRVEVGTPIHDKELKQRVIDILELQWSDTTKSRIIDAEMSNRYVPRGNRRKIRSQIAIYDYLKKVESGKA